MPRFPNNVFSLLLEIKKLQNFSNFAMPICMTLNCVRLLHLSFFVVSLIFSPTSSAVYNFFLTEIYYVRIALWSRDSSNSSMIPLLGTRYFLPKLFRCRYHVLSFCFGNVPDAVPFYCTNQSSKSIQIMCKLYMNNNVEIDVIILYYY